MRKIFTSDALPAARVRPLRSIRPEPRPLLHAEVEDWAMRAALRNGFGGESMAMPGSAALHVEARVAAQAGLGAIVGRVLRLARALSRLLQRRRRQAASWRELQALDGIALRDLALDPSEVGSLHAEIHGRAALTRRFSVERPLSHLPGTVPAFAVR